MVTKRQVTVFFSIDTTKCGLLFSADVALDLILIRLSLSSLQILASLAVDSLVLAGDVPAMC